MPRNGSGVYSLPSIYKASPGELIRSTQHNSPLEDVANEMNSARPISAGGTGATNAGGALTNLGGDTRYAKLAGASTQSFNAATLSAHEGGNGYTYLTGSNIVLGHNKTTDSNTDVSFRSAAGGSNGAYIQREGGANSSFIIYQYGTGPINIAGGSELQRNGNKVLDEGNTPKGTDSLAASGTDTTYRTWTAAQLKLTPNGIGTGLQRWEDVSGFRAANTTYQNLTGKPIQVSVRLSLGAGRDFQVYTPATGWRTICSSGSIEAVTVTPIISPNHSYRVLTSYTAGAWRELR